MLIYRYCATNGEHVQQLKSRLHVNYTKYQTNLFCVNGKLIHKKSDANTHSHLGFSCRCFKYRETWFWVVAYAVIFLVLILFQCTHCIVLWSTDTLFKCTYMNVNNHEIQSKYRERKNLAETNANLIVWTTFIWIPLYWIVQNINKWVYIDVPK